jgi:hypothetical protein
MNERTKKATTHIHTSALYDDFKKWLCDNNITNNIPSNKKFVKELRNTNDYIFDKVKIKNISSTGIKNLQLL